MGVTLLACIVHGAKEQFTTTVACREAAASREATCAATQKYISGAEWREHQREVHRQRVRLIQQQESDDRHSQSLGLTEQSTEQHRCNSISTSSSAWNTM